MIFVEGYEVVCSGYDVDGQPEIVRAVDAAVGYDERVAEDYDAPQSVPVVGQQRGASVSQVNYGRGRGLRGRGSSSGGRRLRLKRERIALLSA